MNKLDSAALMARDETPVTVIRADHVPQDALRDLWEGLRRYDLWSYFALYEVRQRFRRSVLGPFWLTASMGIFVAALALISSTIFQQNMLQTLPYIATGIIFWTFITTCIQEGSNVFISRLGYIQNVPLPLSVHLYQMIARNVIVTVFNMAIYVLMMVLFGVWPGWNGLLFLIGAPLLLVNVTWMALAVGILSARYRDIPQVITSMIQVVFFVTPVFWSTSSMPERPAYVTFNPLYHLLEIVREPLLGRAPSLLNWGAAAALAIVGCAACALLYRRAQPRIAYWV